jgi:tetratricopeptide (TPR) repeat protein
VRQVTRSTVFVLLFIFPLTAGAWEENKSWSDIGTVSRWMEIDASFYRIEDDGPYTEYSQFRLNQKKAYAESKTRNGGLPDPYSIDQFKELDSAEKERRREMAIKELKPVVGFLQVHFSRLQNARENKGTDYGTPAQDLKHLTDSLRHLGNAVGLDPENYYAWHLQGYFASCCGDVDRALASLEAAVRALDLVPADVHLEMKQRVMLDLAWLERDLGLFEKAKGRLDQAAKFGTEPVEARLLRGLIAAQTGDQQTALRMAAELRSQPVRIYPVYYRSAAMIPEVMDVNAWEIKNSDYMQAWIIALMELNKGDAKAATLAFGEYTTKRHYPLAAHFWNDAGLIYERTGRFDLSVKAWGLAISSRPWILNMVYKPYTIRLGELTGNPRPATYFLGFDTFYLVGNRLAYGASLVGTLPVADNPGAKQVIAARALDQLEVCQRTGEYAGQASVLQGQVYYLMNDMQGAMAELNQAQAFFEKEGDQGNLASVKQDLEIIKQNLNAAGIQNFYSQSGRSRGRWDADEDPEATEAELIARLEEDAGDDVARLELARHYIRHGEAEQGQRLAYNLYNPSVVDDRTVEVVTLILEADRALGQEVMADAMLRQLKNGEGDRWDKADLWALVSAICQDHGRDNEARKALEMAQKLDPKNQGIQNQLRMME